MNFRRFPPFSYQFSGVAKGFGRLLASRDVIGFQAPDAAIDAEHAGAVAEPQSGPAGARDELFWSPHAVNIKENRWKIIENHRRSMENRWEIDVFDLNLHRRSW